MVKQLDTDLDCVDYKVKKNQIIFEVTSSRTSVICPFCGEISTKIHSVYQREIQDIPIHNKQTILLLNINKMFCLNPECRHKTFTQRFNFIEPYGKKTKRLTEQILMTSVKLSSVTASALLKSHAVNISKSSICDLLKKNAIDCG